MTDMAILNCLFCGSSARLDEVHSLQYPASNTHKYQMTCVSCHAKGPVRDTPHEAVYRWNDPYCAERTLMAQRPTPPVDRELIEVAEYLDTFDASIYMNQAITPDLLYNLEGAALRYLRDRYGQDAPFDVEASHTRTSVCLTPKRVWRATLRPVATTNS